MMLEVSPQEKELIDYFRGLTQFNQHRLMTIAGTAYDNCQRTRMLKMSNKAEASR